MRSEEDLHRLRIYINESDRLEGKPLYEAIVRAARDHGLTGATAFRGIEGFGANSRIHTVKVLRLSEDLPIVIEIVDQPERLVAFMPTLQGMIAEGMLTVEKVRTFLFRRDREDLSQDSGEIQLESSEFTPVPEVPESVAGPLSKTENAQKVLEAAKRTATESRRVYPDSVDILLAMLCESKGIGRRALKALGVDCKVVERNLHDEVSRDEPEKAWLGRLEKRSVSAAKWLGDEQVSTEHLLLALCEIRPSTATDTLMRLGALPRDVCLEVFKIVEHEDDWQRWMAEHPDM